MRVHKHVCKTKQGGHVVPPAEQVNPIPMRHALDLVINILILCSVAAANDGMM
jgi:hypothetical protein